MSNQLDNPAVQDFLGCTKQYVSDQWSSLFSDDLFHLASAKLKSEIARRPILRQQSDIYGVEVTVTHHDEYSTGFEVRMPMYPGMNLDPVEFMYPGLVGFNHQHTNKEFKMEVVMKCAKRIRDNEARANKIAGICKTYNDLDMNRWKDCTEISIVCNSDTDYNVDRSGVLDSIGSVRIDKIETTTHVESTDGQPVTTLTSNSIVTDDFDAYRILKLENCVDAFACIPTTQQHDGKIVYVLAVFLPVNFTNSFRIHCECGIFEDEEFKNFKLLTELKPIITMSLFNNMHIVSRLARVDQFFPQEIHELEQREKRALFEYVPSIQDCVDEQQARCRIVRRSDVK